MSRSVQIASRKQSKGASMSNQLIEAAVDQPIPGKVIIYSVTKATIEERRKKYMSLKISGVDDKEGLKLVHEARIDCVKARTSIEKTRKEAKADILEQGRKIDSTARELTSLIEPIEVYLLQQEERYEQEQERLRKEEDDRIYNDRKARLDAIGGSLPEPIVRSMNERDFILALARVHDEIKERQVREEREEQERQVRLREEQERIAKVKSEEARLAQERQRMEQERQESEAKQRKLMDRISRMNAVCATLPMSQLESMSDDEYESELSSAERSHNERLKREADERDRLERQRLDQLKKEQSLEEERLRLAEEQRLRDEADLLKKQEEERIAKEMEEKRIAAEQEKQRIARAESLRPDREKLLSVCDQISAITLPVVSAGPATLARDLISAKLFSTIEQIRSIIEDM